MSKLATTKIYSLWALRALRTIVPLVLVATPLLSKMFYVDHFVYRYTGTRSLLSSQVLMNDAIIFSALIALFYVSYLPRIAYIASIVLRTLAFFVSFLYVVDCFVIRNFATRLVMADAIKYASYSFEYIEQIYYGKGFLLLVAAFSLAALVVLSISSRYKIRSRSIHGLFVSGIVFLYAISHFGVSDNGRYVHSWIYINVIDYNLTVLSEAKAYSDDFVDRFEFEDEKSCDSNIPETPNIILLMVESLSSYQSEFFSGIMNWTPNIDAIAGKNFSYTNYYSNGWTTEDGEISLLTGLLPIYAPANYSDGGGTAFNGFFGIEESLPRVLKKRGYATSYMTSADLKFAKTGAWAVSMGFDQIEGHRHPYYKKWKRYHFKAAPDEALYNRVLARVRQRVDRKQFIFIKTVSTHHPFVNPENGNKSEEETFRYADKQIGVFYKRLMDEGFFEDGVLIITGDHHAMVPLRDEEIELFGSLKSAARIPLIISYGDSGGSVLDQQFQQIDVFNGISGLVSGIQCSSDWIGDVFGKKSAKFIAHRRGDNRNIVSVFSGEQDFLVMLDGDDSRVITDKPADEEIRELIINKINSIRIPQRTSRSASR